MTINLNIHEYGIALLLFMSFLKISFSIFILSVTIELPLNLVVVAVVLIDGVVFLSLCFNVATASIQNTIDIVSCNHTEIFC